MRESRSVTSKLIPEEAIYRHVIPAGEPWIHEIRNGRGGAGQRLVVLEAMKMEVRVTAPHAGTVKRLDCAPGLLVTGQRVVLLRPELEP